MKKKQTFKLFLFLAFSFAKSYSQNNIEVSFEKLKCEKSEIYKIEIVNNFKDSICYLPLAINYLFNKDSVTELEYMTDSVNAKLYFYLTISKLTVDNIGKVFKLMPGHKVFLVGGFGEKSIFRKILSFYYSLSIIDLPNKAGSNYFRRRPNKSLLRLIKIDINSGKSLLTGK